MPPMYWLIAYCGDGLRRRHYYVYRSIIGCMALLDLFMVPATVYWDCRSVDEATQHIQPPSDSQTTPTPKSHPQPRLPLHQQDPAAQRQPPERRRRERRRRRAGGRPGRAVAVVHAGAAQPRAQHAGLHPHQLPGQRRAGAGVLQDHPGRGLGGCGVWWVVRTARSNHPYVTHDA